MYNNHDDLPDDESEERLPKIPKGTPQASMTAFWTAFTSKYPGTVRQILPKNPYAASKSAAEPKGLVSSYSVRKSYEEAKAECIKTVDKIANECRRCNLRYRDPHFDIEWDLKLRLGDCLFGLSGPPEYDGLNSPRAVKRVHQIFEQPRFYIEGPSTSDIRQGLSDDCWFLAALGSLGSKSGLIENICVRRYEDVGVYGFVFHRDGEWTHTVIDDKLYLKKSDWDESKIEKKEWQVLSFRDDPEEEYRKAFQTGSRALYFAACTDPNETWLPLLEKAYAKAHGDYKCLDGGFSGEAIEDLTGGVATEVLTADIMDTNQFWKEELLQVNKKFLFGCATGRFDDWQGGGRFTDRKGIQPSHSYSIMEAREIEDKRLLKVRNPWGQTEWTGAWSDGSPQWNAKWLERLNHKFGNDGIFWIEYSDWLRKFHFLDRIRLFDDSWRITQQWVSLQVPWSADYHATKFTFTLSEKGPVVVVLSQLDDRYWYDFKGEYVFSLHFRINKTGEEDYLVRSHGNYFMKRSVSTEVDLEPGTYEVRMKVSAYRAQGNPTVRDVVKNTVYSRQEKLIQVAMSYDLAHAKGVVIETEEEKQRRAEQSRQDLIAAKAEAIASAKKLKYARWLESKKIIDRQKKRAEQRRAHRQRKTQQETQNGLENGLGEGQQLQNGGTPSKTKSNRRSKHRGKPTSGDNVDVQDSQPENFEPEGPWEDAASNNFDGARTTEDQINMFNRESAFKHPQPVHSRLIYQNYVPDMPQKYGRGHPVHAPPSVADTLLTFDSSVDSVLDADLFPAKKDNNEVQNNPLNEDEYDASDLDSDLEVYAAQPWNAVCVVGLRLYTQKGQATIKVVRPEDSQTVIGEEIITNGNTNNIAGSQTLVPPAPLDVDDQVKGLSEDVPGPIVEGGEATTLLPVRPRVAEQQDERTPNHQGNQGNQGRRDRRGRRDRGRGQGRGQDLPKAQAQGQNQVPTQVPTQILNQVPNQAQAQNRIQNQVQDPRRGQNQVQGRGQDRPQGNRQGQNQGPIQGQAQFMAPGLIQVRGLQNGQTHNRHQAPNQAQAQGRNGHQGQNQARNQPNGQGRRHGHRHGHGRGFASI